jgi:hypothetical protein
MKKINKYLLILAVFVGFTSCDSEEFLSEPTPTDAVSDAAVYGSVSGVEAAMTGTYNVLRDYYASHDTAGSKAYYLGADVMATDVTCPDFNWYIFETRWDVVDSADGRRTNWAWEMFYSVANACRTHIVGISSAEALSQSQKDDYIAELQALEAHCYFNLVRYYSHSYAADPSKPGVPIHTIPLSENPEGAPRGTIQDTYNHITTLLETAIPNIPTTQNAKFRFNKSIAQGILARVYLEMGQWSKAATTASLAKAGYPLMNATEYQAGFNDLNNAEWMWGMPFNAEQQFGFPRFYSFIDHSSDGYNDLYLSVDFADMFTSTTDVRKNLVVVNDPSDPYKNYITTKFQDLADQSGDLIYMRSSEMWMIEAEAKAEMTDLSGAKTALLAVLKARDPSAVLSTATTKEALVNEILIERRKEFYGELGVGYFDLKRRNKGLVRDGVNQRWPLTVPAGDSRWAFFLPQAEIDKNDQISESDQN